MTRKIAAFAGILYVHWAWAITMPPYEVYPYLGDDGDAPKVNYMKVCEPGRSGEANASYVVLGISYPRTYQAVDGDFNGELVIPAYIDGLPVRKINEAAFVECNKMKSVRIPSTVREIGDRAFADCLLLTNITFEAGLTSIGNNVFSNCISLAEVRFPKSLSRLGCGCFQGCIALTDVYFDGNAPRLAVPHETDKSVMGESIFRQYGYYKRFRVHINRNTFGWISPYEKGVPEKWPVDNGYMQAHETVEETGGTAVTETGFVTVISEIKGGTVAIPESWSRRFCNYRVKFGDDFAASLTLPTGKRDAAGNVMQVWQDYVAGTDPTDETDCFKVKLTMNGDEPVIEVSPELSEQEKALRKYTLWGKSRLADADWTEVAAGKEKEFNFFRVTVEMK